jgi:hypothetical protein
VRASLAVPVLLAALVLGACRDGGTGGGTPAESRRTGRVEREGFRPPADAVLTADQVEAFLKVRREAVRELSVPGPPAPLEGEEGISGASESRAAEIRAARSLSVPVEEYLWVRERVLEAEAAAVTAKLNADILALLEKTLASLRDRRAAAPDEASRQILDEQIASFSAEAARVKHEAAEKEPESVRANMKVLEPHRPKLSAIADELAQLRMASATPPAPPK